MAINILSHSVHYWNRHKVECKCGCIFTFERQDVITNIYGEFVNCPDCKESIIVNDIENDTFRVCYSKYEKYKEENQPERTEAKWKINCDGYYPYCSKCGSEPPSGEMTLYCPSCGACMGKDETSK